MVKIDPRYFRPAEVDTLLGDPSRAHAKLGWTPKTSLEEMVKEMIKHDPGGSAQGGLSKAQGLLRWWDLENEQAMAMSLILPSDRFFVAGGRGHGW